MTTNFTLTTGAQRLGGVELILNGESSYAVAIKFPNGTVREFCKRCGGTGEYSFNLMDGTVCYGCGGRALGATTTEADIIRKAVNREKARARAAAKAEKAAAEARSVLATWEAQNADLVAALIPHRSRVDDEGYTDFDWRPVNNFLTSLADQAKYRPLSPKQVEAAHAALARQAGWDAEKAQKTAQQAAAGHYGTVGGKVNVTVEIVATKFFPGEWNRSNSTLVTMKTDEGHTLKTFSSGEFGMEAEKGQRVTITGTVKAHGDYNGLPETTLIRVKKG